MSRLLTDDQRDEIVRRFELGEPLDAIATDFGTYKGFVSALALKRGCKPRHAYGRVERTIRLRPEVDEQLARLARRQRTTADMIMREAIAAYLGMDR